MRGTQIYLEDKQIVELKRRARLSRRSVSAIVREAINEKLTQPADTRSADARLEDALNAAFGIWRDRDDLGSTDEYVGRLRGRAPH
jgi:Ribbon-helix-helix protein, copG family